MGFQESSSSLVIYSCIDIWDIVWKNRHRQTVINPTTLLPSAWVIKCDEAMQGLNSVRAGIPLRSLELPHPTYRLSPLTCRLARPTFKLPHVSVMHLPDKCAIVQLVLLSLNFAWSRENITLCCLLLWSILNFPSVEFRHRRHLCLHYRYFAPGR